jgi:hypothetical protein
VGTDVEYAIDIELAKYGLQVICERVDRRITPDVKSDDTCRSLDQPLERWCTRTLIGQGH